MLPILSIKILIHLPFQKLEIQYNLLRYIKEVDVVFTVPARNHDLIPFLLVSGYALLNHPAVNGCLV